tara:strand:- start:135 stop:467 length:333 start_codon:yes stop_codon:yes gene_type:complete
MYVSVTALKARGFLSEIRFWLLAVPVFKQARSSAGILFCEAKSVDGFHHTLTAWQTKKDMQKFVLSPIHQKAMKIFPEIATGSTIGYETDKMPTRDEALLMWRKTAVNYN